MPRKRVRGKRSSSQGVHTRCDHPIPLASPRRQLAAEPQVLVCELAPPAAYLAAHAPAATSVPSWRQSPESGGDGGDSRAESGVMRGTVIELDIA